MWIPWRLPFAHCNLILGSTDSHKCNNSRLWSPPRPFKLRFPWMHQLQCNCFVCAALFAQWHVNCIRGHGKEARFIGLFASSSAVSQLSTIIGIYLDRESCNMISLNYRRRRSLEAVNLSAPFKWKGKRMRFDWGRWGREVLIHCVVVLVGFSSSFPESSSTYLFTSLPRR